MTVTTYIKYGIMARRRAAAFSALVAVLAAGAVFATTVIINTGALLMHAGWLIPTDVIALAVGIGAAVGWIAASESVISPPQSHYDTGPPSSH